MQGENVTTWADGYGIWHARVTFPTPGYGPSYLDGEVDRIRSRARRAIRREIAQRENLDPRYRCRIEIADNDLDHINVMWSITYREKV